MLGLSPLIGMHSVIYGFNFLFGVLSATLVKTIMKLLNKTKVVKRQYTNNFLMDRISNTCFDIMVVAGIAAIRLDALKDYWEVLLILGVVGLVVTYFYNLFVSRVLFKEYADEQFLMMYGMLTGTASTGIILLRELDGDFKTPAADNLVYQNFPAMVFGFPIMLLANKFVPENPELSLVVLGVFFIVMNIILFRSKIFKKKQ
jgi:ESS family glutamate:Na+ symporter